MQGRDPLTIARVPLDADTAEGESVGSCRGTLEYAGKPRRVIPTMDTLGRIARRRIGDRRWSPRAHRDAHGQYARPQELLPW